eukprot:272673-Rhodomonas_salina.1
MHTSPEGTAAHASHPSRPRTRTLPRNNVRPLLRDYRTPLHTHPYGTTGHRCTRTPRPLLSCWAASYAHPLLRSATSYAHLRRRSQRIGTAARGSRAAPPPRCHFQRQRCRKWMHAR